MVWIMFIDKMFLERTGRVTEQASFIAAGIHNSVAINSGASSVRCGKATQNMRFSRCAEHMHVLYRA